MALALATRSLCRNTNTVLRNGSFVSRPGFSTIAAHNNRSIVSKITQQNWTKIQQQPIRFSSDGGSHTLLWTAERALSLVLLAAVPAAIAVPSQGLDALLALSIVVHQHWGLEAIVTDYVRPIIFGNVLPKVAHGLLFLFSAATLGGLFYFIYNDIGIAKAIRKLWAVKGQ